MPLRTGSHQRLELLSPLSSANISSRPGASLKSTVICKERFPSEPPGHASRGILKSGRSGGLSGIVASKGQGLEAKSYVRPSHQTSPTGSRSSWGLRLFTDLILPGFVPFNSSYYLFDIVYGRTAC